MTREKDKADKYIRNFGRLFLGMILIYVMVLSWQFGLEVWVDLWWQVAIFMFALVMFRPERVEGKRNFKPFFFFLSLGCGLGVTAFLYHIAHPDLTWYQGMNWGSGLVIGGYFVAGVVDKLIHREF